MQQDQTDASLGKKCVDGEIQRDKRLKRITYFARDMKALALETDLRQERRKSMF